MTKDPSPTRQSPTTEIWPARPTENLLQQLLHSSVILSEELDKLTSAVRDNLLQLTDRDKVLEELKEHRLLTEFQAERVRSGNLGSLLLGNYRLLDHLGAGGMGMVFEAEHILLRQLVALKILVLPPLSDEGVALARFYSEMRAVAQLQHPNIVGAKDAGQSVPDDPNSPILHYLVMEFVPGLDLEIMIQEHGPLPVHEACDIAYQIADALGEAHRCGLIHRDVKPSNILVTPEGRAKLLDFGLARQRFQSLTEPGTILGTLEFMAPEQARDASKVDGRTDIYGLGGTLYWCLTGKRPFPRGASHVDALVARLNQEPPLVRKDMPDLSRDIETLLVRMMANDSEERIASAELLQRALRPFLQRNSVSELQPVHRSTAQKSKVSSVLLVDDETDIRSLCQLILESDDLDCDEASDGGRPWKS